MTHFNIRDKVHTRLSALLNKLCKAICIFLVAAKKIESFASSRYGGKRDKRRKFIKRSRPQLLPNFG